MKTTILTGLMLVAVSAMGTLEAADAKANWEKHCAKCHGADGKGDTKMGKKLDIRDLTDAAVQAKLTDEQAFKSIKEGVKDKAGKVSMKPAEGVTDEEIKALVGYVRGLKK